MEPKPHWASECASLGCDADPFAVVNLTGRRDVLAFATLCRTHTRSALEGHALLFKSRHGRNRRFARER